MSVRDDRIRSDADSALRSTMLGGASMSGLNMRKDPCELDFLALGRSSTGSIRA